jgi:aspartate/methionine/tyrosine aminotransferase
MSEAYRERRDELLGILDFARSLIERERVAVAPGSAFGELGEGYMRLSLASSREDLLEGASRLVWFVNLLGEAHR